MYLCVCSIRNHRIRHHCLFPRKKEKLKWNLSLPRRCMCNNILQLRQHSRLRKKPLKTFSIPFFFSSLSLYLSSLLVVSISPKYLPAHFVTEIFDFTNIYAQPMPFFFFFWEIITEVWTNPAWLWWFGSRLELIFETALSCLKNWHLLQKWSKETQK